MTPITPSELAASMAETPLVEREERVVTEWSRALQMAYKHAKAEREAQLSGAIWRKFDQQGVHSYSGEWGRVFACEVIIPELAVLRAEIGGFMGPVALRQQAHDEATAEYIQRVREEAA